MIKKWASYNFKTGVYCASTDPVHLKDFLQECDLTHEKVVNVMIDTDREKLEIALLKTPKERFKG